MKLEDLDFKLCYKDNVYTVSSEAVSCMNFMEGTITIEINENGDEQTFDMNDWKLLMNTGINDINGDSIYEGDLVNQRSVLLFDDDEDFTGVVEYLEGQWWIANHIEQKAIPLWSEHRENRIIN